MDITQILLNALSSDGATQRAATEQLQQLENTNFQMYVMSLTGELFNESKPQDSRQLAGLNLKNTIYAKSEERQEILSQRWLALAADLRSQVKQAVLSVLGSNDARARSTAAQIVGKIACIEIPQNQWPDVMNNVLSNCVNTSNRNLRLSGYECLGYICEELHTYLHSYSNSVLTCIASGIHAQQTDIEILNKATMCLMHSLSLAAENFKKEDERNHIFTMMFLSAQCPDMKTRIAALQCMATVVGTYYEYLNEMYMKPIFDVTTKALQEGFDIGLAGIEVWCSLCDKENEMNEYGEEGLKHIIASYYKQICPLFLQLLTTQESEDPEDDDEFTCSKAAVHFLSSCTECIEDQCVEQVLPFVQAHIMNTDWHFKDAAILAFGCILEAPAIRTHEDAILRVLPTIIQHTKDSVPLVRDTATWTLGRIFECVPNLCKNPQVLPGMCQLCTEGALHDSNKISAKYCWIIKCIATNLLDLSCENLLEQYFLNLLTALLQTCDRGEQSDRQLMINAYESLDSLLQCASLAHAEILAQLFPQIGAKLASAITKCTNDEKFYDAQTSYIAILTTIFKKFKSLQDRNPQLQSFIDTNHQALLQVLCQVLSLSNTTAHSDAYIAIGTTANALGERFAQYLPQLLPFITKGLENIEEYRVCSAAVGAIDDISISVGAGFACICDPVMNILLSLLQNPDVETSVKPFIIFCIGDIALGLGAGFTQYIQVVCQFICQAASTTIAMIGDENIDYLCQLRISIFECLSGIILSSNDDKSTMMRLLGTFQPFEDYVTLCYKEEEEKQWMDEKAFEVCLSFIRDLAEIHPNRSAWRTNVAVKYFIKDGIASESLSIQNAAKDAQYALKQK